jgi:predicted MFS family arabinose efflux permease
VTLLAFVLGAAGLFVLAASPPLGVVLVAVAMAFIASTALVVFLDARAGDLAPPERRSAVMSTYATFLDLGAALGPLVGLSVGTLGALRWAFVAGALILIVMAISYRLVMATDERRPDARDAAATRPASLD